jgi:hypothetical protein
MQLLELPFYLSDVYVLYFPYLNQRKKIESANNQQSTSIRVIRFLGSEFNQSGKKKTQKN